ncbi:hypothetical protein QBC40DRAFT_212791 [Triangularia verruculosa]|uniref:Uncharacterized protein n=1 Tax=Triangularia verruculosa TaxID=2587418 RepID=A0AAN7APX9_9PEZI|nr:hypothetical protein QBC40DRAFT_212791 [Triangularia verruculosa]
MVEEITSGPLGFALLGLIMCASWGYTGPDAAEVALSKLDEIAEMVGKHLRVLFPGVRGWEGTESRKRWAGREGNPTAPWTKEIRTKSFGSFFNKCVSCRHNTGPFPMPQDESWANWFESIAQRHDYHQARRGTYQPDPPPAATEPQASPPGQPPVPDSTKAQEFVAAWTPVWDDTLAILQKKRSLWSPTRTQSEQRESPIYIEIPKRRKRVGEPPVTPHGMIPGSWSPRPARPRTPTPPPTPPPPPPPPSPDTVRVIITGPGPATNTGYTIALPETPTGGAPKDSGSDAQFLQLIGTPRAPKTQSKPKTPRPVDSDRPPATPRTQWNRQHLGFDQRIAVVKHLYGQVARRFPRGRAGVLFTGATTAKKDGEGGGEGGGTTAGTTAGTGTGTGETGGTGGTGATGQATGTKPAEEAKPTDETQQTDQTKPPDATKADTTAPPQSTGQGLSSSLLRMLALVGSTPSFGTSHWQPAEDHSEEARLRLCQQWDDWSKMPLPTTQQEWDNPKSRPPDDVPSHRQETILPNSEGLII